MYVWILFTIIADAYLIAQTPLLALGPLLHHGWGDPGPMTGVHLALLLVSPASDWLVWLSFWPRSGVFAGIHLG